MLELSIVPLIRSILQRSSKPSTLKIALFGLSLSCYLKAVASLSRRRISFYVQNSRKCAYLHLFLSHLLLNISELFFSFEPRVNIKLLIFFSSIFILSDELLLSIAIPESIIKGMPSKNTKGECTICLDPDSLETFCNYNHLYHSKCINAWINSGGNFKCLVCFQDFLFTRNRNLLNQKWLSRSVLSILCISSHCMICQI